MSENVEQRVVVLAPQSTIAQAVIARIGQRGGTVACVGRNVAAVDKNAYVWMAECDLTDFESVTAIVQEAQERLGGLTGLVNCAGSILLKPAHLTSREEYDDTIGANVTTAFATVRAAAHAFGSSGGSVVLVSSAAATLGMVNHEAIAAAKGAVEALVRSAASTYASRGIRFNAVAPGLVETRLSEPIVKNAASRKVSESLHPLGRIGTAAEVASAICWLLDPEQTWVTGQVIGVDGGLSRVQPRPKLGQSNR